MCLHTCSSPSSPLSAQKRQFPFLTNSASPCAQEDIALPSSAAEWVALVSCIHPAVPVGGRISISCVVSHREGPRAAKMGAADALNGFWRPPTHCGKGHAGFGRAHRVPVGDPAAAAVHQVIPGNSPYPKNTVSLKLLAEAALVSQ